MKENESRDEDQRKKKEQLSRMIVFEVRES
jgi:hypothetical protein